MYLDLIDVVSTIVRRYGVGILSEPRFWHILSDSYSFATNYSLRDVFKNCIKTGYVSQLVSLKGNPKETRKLIQNIADTENHINANKEKELAAALFSVAISIGTLTKNDYFEFTSSISSQSNPKPNISPNTKSTTHSNLSFGQYVGLTLIVVFGVISTIGATVFYSLFYKGWWLFFIILFTGIVQLFYSAIVKSTYDETKDSHYKEIIKSIIIPFLGGMVLNAFIAFFFFNQSFRIWLSEYLYDTAYEVEAPTLLTVILSICNVLWVGELCAFSLSPNSSKISPNLKNINKRIVIWTSVLLIIGYMLLFILPSIASKIHENKIRQEQLIIDKKINQQELINRELQDQRKNEFMELSFKGIELGISWDSVMGYVQTIVKSDSSTSINPDRIKDEYFYTYFRKDNDIMETLTNAHVSSKPKEKAGNDWVTGRLLKFYTTLDNQEVKVQVFGIDDKVFAISIIPEFRISNGIYDGVFEKYKDIVALYTRKYGEPELIRDRSYYEESSNKDKTIYSWTFKNGAVWLNYEYVVYVPSSFFTLAEEIATQKELKMKEEERRLKYLQFQKDSIAKAKQTADSLRHVRNHQNAINEI